MRFTMRKEKCAECGAPMRRTGFNENQRGDTVFTYQCEKCGYTMKKTLKRGVAAGTMRNDLGAPEADALRAELRRLSRRGPTPRRRTSASSSGATPFWRKGMVVPAGM